MLQDNMSHLRSQLAQSSIASSPATCGTASSTSNIADYHQSPVANINRFLHPTNFMGSRTSNASTNTSGYQSFSSSSASLEHSFPSTSTSNATYNVSPDTTSNNNYAGGNIHSSSNEPNVS